MTAADPEAFAALVDAATTGQVEAVRALLDRHPQLVHARDDQGHTVLYWTAMYGCNGRSRQLCSLIELLRARGAEVDLCAAAFLDDRSRAEEILWADPERRNDRDGMGLTPLHFAAMRGSDTVTRLLIEYSADVDAKDQAGLTPLHYASHPGPWKAEAAPSVIRQLRAAGATVTVWLAAALGEEAALSDMLEADPALLNARDRFGATPLFHAARNLCLQTVGWLLQRNADPNVANREGLTPAATVILHRWDANGPETLDLLRKHGAVLDLFDACALGDLARAEEILGTDPSQVHAERGEQTPVQVAVRSGYIDLGMKLVAAGAEVDIGAAAGLGLTDRVTAALGKDPDLLDEPEPYSGHTPLHRAAENGQADTVAVLLERGADPSRVTTWGATPLHLSAGPIHRPANAEWPRTVRLLIEHGADPRARDHHGSTPIDYARHEKMTEVIAYLKALD